MTSRRYTRQVRLAEIGEAGQENISAAEVRLASSTAFAREVEERYLRAAGVTRIRPPAEAPGDVASLAGLGLRHGAAAEVGEGALAALVALRAALGLAKAE